MDVVVSPEKTASSLKLNITTQVLGNSSSPKVKLKNSSLLNRNFTECAPLPWEEFLKKERTFLVVIVIGGVVH